MMAKNPAERFQTAAEAGRALKKWAKRKTMQFSMTEILNIRADHARKKQKSRMAARSSEVTSGSAWTSSNARLSGTLRQQGIETAVARDTLPMTSQSPNASQPLRVIPLEPTSDLAASVTEQFDSLNSQGPFALVSLDGETSFPLENQHVLIGRSSACDVRLDLPGVSSSHCELSFDGMRWHAQDLDSKNGIQINGKAVNAAELPVGSKLTIARKHVFRVINLSEPVPSEKGTLLYHAIGWPLLAGLGYLVYWLLT